MNFKMMGRFTGQIIALEAGFMLTALFEDVNGSGRLHDLNIPCYTATRAVKP